MFVHPMIGFYCKLWTLQQKLEIAIQEAEEEEMKGDECIASQSYLWTNLPEIKLDAEFRRAFLEMTGPNCCQIGTDPDEPAMILHIKSIGRVNSVENVIHCKNISDFVESRLGIPPVRVMIHFQSLEKHEVGKGGTTVEMLLADK
uniref:Uncharacterized protein n=1 Tax=Globodera rostochiensis TaxID=31243 RepID=A0A914HY24_GLORO